MKLITTILITFQILSLQAQFTDMQRVMLIGEEDKQYEQLVSTCQTMLLQVSDYNMQVAYDRWMSLLADIESAADEADFDIKGVKMWVNVFWNEDGTIKNIYYYPKPKSKNMDFARLSDFLEGFSATYVMDIENETCFSHYGSAA